LGWEDVIHDKVTALSVTPFTVSDLGGAPGTKHAKRFTDNKRVQ